MVTITIEKIPQNITQSCTQFIYILVDYAIISSYSFVTVPQHRSYRNATPDDGIIY
jgi:hypothetical protein